MPYNTRPVLAWVFSCICCAAAVSLILAASLRDYVAALSGISEVVASSFTAIGVTIIHAVQILLVPAARVPTFSMRRRRATIITLTIFPFALSNIVLIAFFAKYDKAGLELALEMVCFGHALLIEVRNYSSP